MVEMVYFLSLTRMKADVLVDIVMYVMDMCGIAARLYAGTVLIGGINKWPCKPSPFRL